MNFIKLLIRNIYFYRRTHLSIILGCAFATAVLVGALVVGDSVRYSLRQMVFERLGTTEFTLESGERYFHIRLADKFTTTLQTHVAPVLKTRGLVSVPGSQHRLNRVQVMGVDSRFGKLGQVHGIYDSLAQDEVIINTQLASRLDLKVQDELLLRLEKLDFLPKDAPLAQASELVQTLRLRVRDIVSGQEYGHFNLNANQVVPYNAYVSLSMLSSEMDLDNRANILLISKNKNEPVTINILNDVLRQHWSPTDAGIDLIELKNQDIIELRSPRIFLDSPVINAAFEIDRNAQPVFTYFVNTIYSASNSTPYSFVSAPGIPFVPAEMNDDEIIINTWLANDLEVCLGDSITLAYYVLGPMRQLIEGQTQFRIIKIVPLSGIYADRELMPAFPGLADQENCRDWQPGIPINLDKIRTKDEDYWDLYRGTPKAFITLKAAQNMWQNRFGKLTAIRFKNQNIAEIEQKFSHMLDPVSLGFRFINVKEEGLRASDESVNFAQLFIGLSFFIVMSALLLTSLLFILATEQRSQERGLLMAVGIPQSYVKRIMLAEGSILAFIGVISGIILGIVYNEIVLYGLETVWRDAVGTSDLTMHITGSTVLTGSFLGFILAILTMWLVIRKESKQSVSTLMTGSSKIESIESKSRLWLSSIVGSVSIIVVLIILITTNPGRGGSATAFFFVAGFLLLLAGIAFTNIILVQSARKTDVAHLTIPRIGIRNNARHKTRSLTLIGLLSSALFIVFMVGANRHGTLENARLRSAGTGGFAFFAETVMPILHNLNSDKGREFYALQDDAIPAMQFVQFRLKEGDDASCLNLNRVSNPHLLGLDPQELDHRGAFTFVKLVPEADKKNPWLSLNKNFVDVVPAVADETVIVWGLGKSVGDTLEYRDEKGNSLKLKLIGGLANSIFQGHVLISEKNFIAMYPSQSGYRLFLIDVATENMNEVYRILNWSLQDYGIELVPAADRLAEFNKVENTYLSIFLILGGLGLILGTMGIGIVVIRNILERRGELALLKALGYDLKSLYTLLLSEHFMLLIIAIMCGVIAALIAVLPALLSPGAEIPYLTILIILFIVTISVGIWTIAATALATRGNLLPALRNE